MMLMRRFGRLPVLFWTQLLALGFLIGATFAPNLATFAGELVSFYFGWHGKMNARISDALSHRVLRVRCLCSFVEPRAEGVSRTCPQVTVRFWIHCLVFEFAHDSDVDSNRACLWSQTSFRSTFRRGNSTCGHLALLCMFFLVPVLMTGVLRCCVIVHRSFHLLYSVSSLHGKSGFFGRVCECVCELNGM